MVAFIFTVLYLAKLKIDDLFSLLKSTLDVARPVINTIGGIPLAAFTQLETDNNAMGEQMNRASKSVLTEPLVEMDDDRDNRYAEIKRNISTAAKSRNNLKKAAGENLKIFFGPYWDVNRRAMNTQTGTFTEMFGKFNADATLKAQAVTIGIDTMMAELETVNNDFDALYKQRNAIDAEQQGPSATSLKSAAVKSYEQFCTAIEQAVNFTPTPELKKLFKEMDELRKVYAKLIHKNNKEEEETQPAVTE